MYWRKRCKFSSLRSKKRHHSDAVNKANFLQITIVFFFTWGFTLCFCVFDGADPFEKFVVAAQGCNAIYGSLSVFSPLNILFFVISFGFSIMINLSLSFVLGMVTFITTNMWGILQIYQAVFRLLSGALIPLSFFHYLKL